MHLVSRAALCFAGAISLFACAPRDPLTPRAAFRVLKTACDGSDAAALEGMLSMESVLKVRRMTLLFSHMDARTRVSLSKGLGVPAGRLRSLTVRDYCALMLRVDRERNAFIAATRHPVVAVNRKGNMAIVRVRNGMELHFVREGPYWKFDMTLL